MFDTCACFLTFSCEGNCAWITKNTNTKEWVLRKSHVCPTYTAESLYQGLSENFVMNANENRCKLSITREFHDQMFSTRACLLMFSCKCNHTWFNTIKYKSNRLHRPIFPKTDHARKRSSNHAKITFRSHVDYSTVLLLADVKQLRKTYKWEQVVKHHFKSQEKQLILHNKFMQKSWLRCNAPMRWAQEWPHSQTKH
jgi:hypothetical protein